MGKYDQPGYPLPPGELGEDEIVCQLVYLPNRHEYWQAFYGALSYMATWRAWERDDDKRGKDAAANWREALELTTECWRMTCLDELQDNVAAILALLQTNAGCCAENITYGAQTTYVTTIVINEGDAPDYYGETAVADWDEWLEYLCFSAHAWVDHLVSQANSLELALSLGGLTMALLGYVFGAVNFLLMRGDINSSTLLSRLSLMAAGYAADMFSDASDAIESAREDIVCAVMQGTSMSDAVEDSLSSGIAWDIFFQFVDYDSAKAIMYEGGDGEDYLEAEQKDDCGDCGQIGEHIWYTDWETGTMEGWNGTDNIIAAAGIDGSWGWKDHLTGGGTISLSANNFAVHLELSPQAGDLLVIHSLRFWWKIDLDRVNNYMKYSCSHDGGEESETFHEFAEWIEEYVVFDPPLESVSPHAFVVNIGKHSGTAGYIYLDNITIDFDFTPA
jgi:hypothetical protein